VLTYLPNTHELLGVVGLAATLLLFLVLGSAATPRATLPEIRLVAGWGVACLVLTAWGVLTPWSLLLPAAALALTAMVCLASPGCRARISSWSALGRMLLLTLPLWLVMLSIWPSQIDTWLNLLPNAAYLFDHNMLPTATRPPSYSFLPVAPYNTQFADYLASLASGAFADGAMGLFNVTLLCASGLLLARAVTATAGVPPWWACAVGLLLAGPLNPGFVPRFLLSPYGETSLAVTTLFAVWLAAELLGDLARGIAWPRSVAPLALVLVALVNAKQSGIGLLVPIGAGMLILALSDPGILWRRALPAVGAALLPALVLYLLWRDFALRSGFEAGELQPLPFAEWNFPLIPQIIVAMLVVMFQKATFFLCTGAVLVFAAHRLLRNPWSHEGRLLGLSACVIILFNGFLLFTYVAHFIPGVALGAHSYFRYNSQVSLLVMLGLVVALRPCVAHWLALNPRFAGHGATASVVLIVLSPLAALPLLRFDRDTPQPELWHLGHAVAAYVHPGDRLALVLPNDTDDSVGSMLRGVLLFTPPRRPGLDFRIETSANPEVMSDIAASGYQLALITCATTAMDGVPAGDAAMMRYTPDGWRSLRTWSWPASIRSRQFAGLLARGPLCAEPRRG
jgi:hypothetical protein